MNSLNANFENDKYNQPKLNTTNVSASIMSSTSSKFPIHKYKNYFDSEGRVLRVRQLGKRISQDVKNFIE